LASAGMLSVSKLKIDAVSRLPVWHRSASGRVEALINETEEPISLEASLLVISVFC